MTWSHRFLHALLRAALHPARGCLRPEEAPLEQDARLRHLLRANAASAYGRACGFGQVDGIRAFQERVPLVDYEDLRPWVERVALGETEVLTREPVLLFEPTGGSSGPEKLIPLTRTLLEEFRRALHPWLADLYANHPRVRGGPSYWQVTPGLVAPRRTAGGIPIGLQDDGQYLGRLPGALLSALRIRPAIHPGMSSEAFQVETLRSLLGARDLRLVSLWNPSLFLRMLEALQRDPDPILARLPRERGLEVAGCLERGDPAGLWPDLALISCWRDGLATGDAQRLGALFPQAALQPKGLLATEAVVTLPLEEALGPDGGHVPAWRSHFFEFLDPSGRPWLLHELEPGGAYEVVVTTGGGLYRYRLGDRVRVTRRWRGVGLLAFEGRDRVVDLVGEKLREDFVAATFADLAGFFMLAAREDHYLLYTRHALEPGEVDRRLSCSHSYEVARRVGQLKPARVFLLKGDPEAEYLASARAQGRKPGDLKPAVLSPRGDWNFTGEEIPL